MNKQTFTKQYEAVLFDGSTDIQQIADWCGGEIGQIIDTQTGMARTDTFIIDIPGPNGTLTTAAADFYIVKDGPSFFAMPKHEFEFMIKS